MCFVCYIVSSSGYSAIIISSTMLLFSVNINFCFIVAVLPLYVLNVFLIWYMINLFGSSIVGVP